MLPVTNVPAVETQTVVVEWGSRNFDSREFDQPFKAIAAGGSHTVALKEDGTVVAWGSNSMGQTTIPAGLFGVKAIAAGEYSTIAVKEDGTVVAWGHSYYNGWESQNTVPEGLSGVKTVSAGDSHTVALKEDGTVVVWGNGWFGQYHVPAGLFGVKAIAAGYRHTVALKEDGTVVAWGWNDDGQSTVPSGLSGVKAIAAGYRHTVALKEDGTIVAWGFNNNNQITIPAALSGVKAIAAKGYNTRALKDDGTVVSWSSSLGNQTIFTELSDVKSIAAGNGHMVALKEDGKVVAWGDNSFGQSNDPAALSRVKALAKGGAHTVALKEDGTVIAWGRNGYGLNTVPAGLSAVKAIAAGGDPEVAPGVGHTVALKEDGTVVAWGDYGSGQTTIPAGLSEVKAIAAGGYHTVALKEDGTVVAWGKNGFVVDNNDYDEDYDDSEDNSYFVVTGQIDVPEGLSKVKAIAAGGYHTVALKEDGTVVAWGSNGSGQTTIPAGLSEVKAIAAGGYHTVALKEDGTVVAWGWNDDSQTKIPTGLSDVTAIAAGYRHTVALKEDGKVVAWGANGSGQTTVPAGLSEVKAIAAGYLHTVVLADFTSITQATEIAVLKGTTYLSDGGAATFGNVNRGSNKTLSFTVKNLGTANLTGIAASLSGGNATDFAVVSAPAASLAPGASTTVSVRFTPSAAGARATTLRIASNDADENPFDIALSGSAVSVPEIAVLNGTTNLTDGGAATFGNVNRGSNKTLSFTVKNLGTANLTGISASLNGGNAADFAVVSAPAASLAPGASTTFSVRFTPSAAGARATTLRIASNDADENPFDIALSGSAVSVPEIAVLNGTANLTDGGAATFGNVNRGSNKTLSFTVKNLGTANLTGISASLNGGNAADFAVVSAPAASLAPGASTTFSVRFTPSAAGARATSLRIASNDADENPFDIRLSGSALSVPEIAVLNGTANLTDGGAATFGKVNRGSNKTLSFKVKNLGTANLTGIAASLSGGNATQFKITQKPALSLAPGASTTLKLSFKPTKKGLFLSTLRIASNDADENPFDIKISGKGIVPATFKKYAASQASPLAKATGGMPRIGKVAELLQNGSVYNTITLDQVGSEAEKIIVEVSSDRIRWFSGPEHAKVLVDNAAKLKVRDLTPVGSSKRYIRARRVVD